MDGLGGHDAKWSKSDKDMTWNYMFMKKWPLTCSSTTYVLWKGRYKRTRWSCQTKGQETFSEGRIVMFQACRDCVYDLFHSYSVLLLQQEGSHRRYGNKWARLCSKNLIYKNRWQSGFVICIWNVCFWRSVGGGCTVFWNRALNLWYLRRSPDSVRIELTCPRLGCCQRTAVVVVGQTTHWSRDWAPHPRKVRRESGFRFVARWPRELEGSLLTERGGCKQRMRKHGGEAAASYARHPRLAWLRGVDLFNGVGTGQSFFD